MTPMCPLYSTKYRKQASGSIDEIFQAIVTRYGSFESLLLATENQLHDVLADSEANEEDAKKLILALNNLRKLTSMYVQMGYL